MHNVVLKNNGYTAVIELLGAQLVSFKDPKGQEYIWQRNPDVWANCSPVLFPIVGGLIDDKIKFDGVEYSMEKHGFAKVTKFEVSEQSDNSALFTIRSNEETLKKYPYKFTFSMKYILDDANLKVIYTVKNDDDKKMYYCLGAHPGFICPLYDGETLQDYVLKFEQKETIDTIVHDNGKGYFNVNNRREFLNDSDTYPLSYEMFADDAVYCDKLKSRTVSLINPKTEKGVFVNFPDFTSVAFWTKFGMGYKDYVCIEPWNGSAPFSDETSGEFKDKQGCLSLETNAERAHTMDIKLL